MSDRTLERKIEDWITIALGFVILVAAVLGLLVSLALVWKHFL